MILDFTEFRRVVENHLNANYSTTAIQYENTGLDKEGLTEWVAVFDKPTFAESTGMGETSALTGGVLILPIFTPVGTGTERSRQIAEALAAVLGDTDLGGVSLGTPELHGAPKNESWYQQNLQVPYVAVMGQDSLC